ncbi:MAG: glycosyltransferase family 4 protein, partial [Sulfolobales archaeon]|nr:glycosyltransferase family 4 protein [Sulfolobales archaeon]
LPSYLARKGYDVRILCYSKNREEIFRSGKSSLNFLFINAISISIPSHIEEFPYFLYLKDIIKQIRPDLIHVNNLPSLSSFQAIVLARKMALFQKRCEKSGGPAGI